MTNIEKTLNGRKMMDLQYVNPHSNIPIDVKQMSLSNDSVPNDTSDSLRDISSREKVVCYLKNIKRSEQLIDPYEFRESGDTSIELYTPRNKNNGDPPCYTTHLEVSGHTSFNDNHNLINDNFIPEQNPVNIAITDNPEYKRIVLNNETTQKYTNETQNTSTDIPYPNYNNVYSNTWPMFIENISSNFNMENKLPPETEKTSKEKIRILDYRIIPAPSSSNIVDEIYDNTSTECKNIIYNHDYDSESSSEKSDDSLDTEYKPMSQDSDSSSLADTNSDVLCAEERECEDNLEHRLTDKSYEILSDRKCEDSEDPKENSIVDILDGLQTETGQKIEPHYYIPSPIENGSDSDKDLCPFCFEVVGHFSRHLLRKHSEEDAVKKISEMKSSSKERRAAVIALRRKGNFILNTEKNKIKPVRRPMALARIEDDYYPCTTCLGFFKKSYLWRHKKICNSLGVGKKTENRTNHLSDAQTFIVSTGLLGNYLEKSHLRKEVFPKMKPDKISLVVKSDPLIVLYGESYLNKHKRKQMNVVASNKMREIARLLIALKKFTTIKYCIDFLRPEIYESIVAAAKIICGFDAETKLFKASSLALHLGTNLKFLCDVAKKAVITKNPLLRNIDDHERDRKIREISELKDIISSHWCNDISSLANKVLNELKLERPRLVPLTEDIKCFNNYLLAQATEAYTRLKNNEEVKNNYKRLAECTLCLLLVFNRKRIGEVQYLDINTYEKDSSSFNQDEFQHCLTEFEKNMCLFFKRIVVFGKGSKPVPILFTKQMQEFIDLILKVRRETDIVPKENKYIFANPGSSGRWMSGSDIVRKYAYKCGAKKPELLTSTKFRKQIGTILQLMNFHSDEMEQIARFMGHTEKTHKEFYRLTEDTYQTAKVAKVLLLLNAGKGHEFKGKCLNDIDVKDDVLEFEEAVESGENKHIGYQPERKEVGTKQKLVESPNVEISKPVRTRGRWSATQKQLMLKHFQKNIFSKEAPKKQNCLEFISLHNNLFTDTDWVRIKTFVYNSYRLK